MLDSSDYSHLDMSKLNIHLGDGMECPSSLAGWGDMIGGEFEGDYIWLQRILLSGGIDEARQCLTYAATIWIFM